MEITSADRVRMERAHVAAWPALSTAVIDGWLWRSSGGGSQRANSVSTIDFLGNDPAAALTDAEDRYSQRGAPALFQTFDETSPAGLAAVLRARGYHESGSTVTMFKRSGGVTQAVAQIEMRDHAWAEWRDVYLREITENRRLVNALILDRISTRCRFFGYRQDGEIVSTALCVVAFGCAVIECVATRSVARRQGTARAVLIALEGWATRQGADWIGLQVVPSNASAIRLYETLGFVPGATNSFWSSG
jgi:GNAT superfamily N-acetyltransferase